MSLQLTERLLERVTTTLVGLREEALKLEQGFSDELACIEPVYRDSARNLLHYVAVRRHDIRTLQQDLAALGLSSLGLLEAHTLATLNSVLDVLERLTGETLGPAPEPPVDFRTGPLLLRDHSRSLLGPEPAGRAVRIMVTMPSEAATNPQLIEQLLVAGMDVMRINCAHDGPQQWQSMVRHLRTAERAVGRHCKVQADLAGPKLRTGRIQSAGNVLKIRLRRDPMGQVLAPTQLWLTPADAPEPTPAGVKFTVPVSLDALAASRDGDLLLLTDARGRERRIPIVAVQGNSRLAETRHNAYIAQDAACAIERDGEVVAVGTVGRLPEVVLPIELFPGDTLVLTRADVAGRNAERDAAGGVVQPARIHCTLEAAFAQVKPGQSLWFDDGKIGGIVKSNTGDELTAEITHTGPSGGKLKPEKGINFPETDFDIPALTPKDLVDLREVVGYVDMVALSFLRTADDVLRLEDELHALGAGHLGIVLKIENRQAFENLPRILLKSLYSPPVGVMVARGDLAVEVGFERLSEVQEEILWLCEAAHVPVIWATQMLEGLAKGGQPSRAEVTDAAASSRAECAMLNKGPNIVRTVRFLGGVLSRMGGHQDKSMKILRRLSVSELR